MQDRQRVPVGQHEVGVVLERTGSRPQTRLRVTAIIVAVEVGEKILLGILEVASDRDEEVGGAGVRPQRLSVLVDPCVCEVRIITVEDTKMAAGDLDDVFVIDFLAKD